MNLFALDKLYERTVKIILNDIKDLKISIHYVLKKMKTLLVISELIKFKVRNYRRAVFKGSLSNPASIIFISVKSYQNAFFDSKFYKCVPLLSKYRIRHKNHI